MTHDATTGVNYSFYAENRITGTAGFTYTYDADGNRVKKANGSTGTIYWYMSPGIVAESDLSGNLQSEYVFFNGERVARKDFSGGTTSVAYYFSDHLKTASVITDSAGTIKEDEDYYPWGGELQFVNNDSNHYKFTGKERDAETGLDYFGARYYSNGLGRFITPDWSATPVPVPYADLNDPQSLNQYSYVRSIPTSKADLDGHCTVDGEKHGTWWCIGHALGLQETKKETSQRIEKERVFLLDHLRHADGSALSNAEVYRFQHASQTQIDEYYQQATQDAKDRESDPANEMRRSMGMPPVPVPGSQSTGRTQANNLNEQLAMEQAQSNPTGGQQIQNIQMKDPRWARKPRVGQDAPKY